MNGLSCINRKGFTEMLNTVEGGVSNPEYDFDDYDLREEYTEREKEGEE